MKKLKSFTALAVLSLLALAGTALAAPALKAERPLKGTVEGEVVRAGQPPNLHVTGTGTGNATHLGRFTVEYDVMVNLAIGEGSGTATFTAANGDQLFTLNHGRLTPTGNPGESRLVETYTITGGTGRFEGASGLFSGERLVNLTTTTTTGSFEGHIVFAQK
jgi:hypothetical protein